MRVYDLIIIGGGPAGLTAGLYGGRAQLDVLVIEKSEAGGQIRTTSEVVNYPGIKETTGPELGDTMKAQALNFGVEFLHADVEDVDFSKEIKEIKTDQGIIQGLTVVIATGATPRKLGFPGEKEFTGRGIAYCATCDGQFFTGKDVFVIGAGFAAAEEAIFLTRYARKVTVIAREPEFTCAKTIADKVLANPKIEVKFNSEILEVTGDKRAEKAKFRDNISGEIWEYSSEGEGFGVFIYIGYEPQSALFKKYVETDTYGYIITNENLETSVKDIYAAGDIRPKKLRQVVTAVADGAIAVTNLEARAESKREELGLEKYEKRAEKAEEENFLDSDIQTQLKGIFERFETPVKVVAILDDRDISKEIKRMLKEVELLSDKVSVEFALQGENKALEEKIHADNYPTIAVIDSKGNYRGVKFSGVPSGHELNSFILALYNIAGPGQELSSEIKNSIEAIDHPVSLKIAVSLSCSLCPEVVTSAQRIAIENTNVQAEMIDIFSFRDVEKKYDIMGVPALIVNDKDVYFGKKNIQEILEIIKK